MKKMLFLVAIAASMVLQAQTIRVISDTDLGQGYYPRMVNASTIEYLQDEYSNYAPMTSESEWRVDNENLQLNLYHNGQKTVLTPDGANAHYIWSSLSEDQTMIVYNTAHGTSVCDRQGRVIRYLGHLNAPVWLGNQYIVGMHDYSDGHQFTASSIAIFDLASGKETELVSKENMAMYPTVHAASGRIAYSTLQGRVHLLQLNLCDQPLSSLPQPKLVPVAANQVLNSNNRPLRKAAGSIQPSNLKIYINPGHGGHWSNDRNMTIYPYKSGDVNGFWESNSNLDKGLALDSMLQLFGVQTMMSRRTNNNGGGNDKDLLDTRLAQGVITKAQYDDMLANGDDRSLSAIVAESNAWGPNFMISVHSNAGGPSNYVLMLFAGKSDGDTYTYPSATPCSDEGRDCSTVIGNALQSNTLTPWTTKAPMIYGDKTFGRTAMHWSDGYGVLRRLTSAGVISEGSMHDYIPETYRLMNIDYKMQQAWYFTRSFLQYYCGSGWTTGVIGGQVRDANNKQLFPDITRIRKTNDELEPLCGATVQLMQGGQVLKTYTTDNMYNGLFFFWDLIPGVYTVRVNADHYYTQDVPVVVTANEMSLNNVLMAMKRETRPEVVSYSPCPAQITDSIEVSTPVVLNFNWDMLEDSTLAAFSVSPAKEGKLAFSNSQKTLTFTPNEAWDPGVEYTITLSTQACHPDTTYPNHLEQPFVLTFRTKNRSGLQLLQAYPVDGATEVGLKPTIMLIFDAELSSVAKTQIGKEVEITAAGGFSFIPTSRQTTINTAPSPYGTLRFEVTDALQPQTEYTLNIKTQLKDINDVHILSPIALHFTTGTGIEPAAEGEMIEAFESQFVSMDADQSKGIKSKTIGKNTTTVHEGKGSNKIAYVFQDDVADAQLFLTPSDFHSFYSINGVGLDVYGDLSYNDLYLEFQTEGDKHSIYLGTLDYVGWQHLHVDLTALPADVEFSLCGIRLVRSSHILSGKGEIYLDRLMRSTSATGLNDVHQGAEVIKRIQNGRLMIEHHDQQWDAKGAKL